MSFVMQSHNADDYPEELGAEASTRSPVSLRFPKSVFFIIVYAVGSLVLAVTAIPGVTGVPPHWWGLALGLGLISFGTGGIKPCVSAFGGDQFDPRTQVREIGMFFSMFYFAINCGSVFSMLLTPVLRQLPCYGRADCFPLAFGVPSLLMILATLIFVLGAKGYKRTPPSGSAISDLIGVVATSSRYRMRRVSQRISKFVFGFGGRRDRLAGGEGDDMAGLVSPVDSFVEGEGFGERDWLDYAVKKGFSRATVDDVRTVLKILILFVPLPVFWALYDQQSSRWTYQASLMDNRVNLFGFKFSIAPDQMQTWNAVLILAMIPLFEKYLYPWMARLSGGEVKPLRKIAFGMALVGISFIMAGLLQVRIETAGATYQPDPKFQNQQVCVKNCVNILWQVPQYVILTSGEIFFSITGLEFAYSQAPKSMKSVCQASWQLTTAIGNLIVILVAESHIFEPAPEFFFFGLLLFGATGVFGVL
ncbi:hypothetical protein HK102_013308, partial [Quaeritorhiza haematococci]